MSDRKYLELSRGFIDFDLKVLYPWKTTDGDQKKLSKWFKSLNIAHGSLVLLLLSFVYFEWNNLSIVLFVENISTASE